MSETLQAWGRCVWRIHEKARKGEEGSSTCIVRADRLDVMSSGCLSFVRADVVVAVVPFGQYARCELIDADNGEAINLSPEYVAGDVGSQCTLR